MDLKEAIGAAIDAPAPSPSIESPSISEPAPEYKDEFSEVLDKPTEKSSPSLSRSPGRDEKGRFLPKSAEQIEDQTTLVEEVGQQSEQSNVEARAPQKSIPPIPSGFGKYKSLWEKLNDPAAQFGEEDKQSVLSFHREREGEMLKGIAQYKDQAEKSHYLAKAMEPYIPELLANNIDPAVHIRNLSEAHRILSRGSQEEKIRTFQHLAHSYGISYDPNQGQIAALDPMAHHMMEQLRGMQSTINHLQNERLQSQSDAIQSEIQALQADVTNFPFFEEAREAMASLLEQGHAKTFEEAYKKALRLDESLWEKESERLLASRTPKPSVASNINSNVSHLQKAKQAAVSVTSTAPSGASAESRRPISPATNQRNSLKDALTRAFG